MAYVIGSAAGHLTPLYPTHRKDVDILESHALISQLRQYMVSETGYDEKKRLKEAIAKVQKAISAGQSEPPAPFRDPFVYVSDERVRTVLDGRQPEPLSVDIEGFQSVHHAAPGPGPKQEPVIKGGRGKGKKGEKGGKGGSPSGPPPKSGEVPGKGSGKGGSPPVPKAKAKDDAGPAPMEVDAAAAQPKKTWVAIAVEGARPSAKAKMTPVPKAEPKGKVASVSEAKSAPPPKAEAKETKQAEPRVEVKKEKVGGVDGAGGSRGSAEGQKRERKSRWDPDEAVKESTKREASTRPDDVDSSPGAAAREASGDDLHSALGRSSAKDAVAPLTAKAMAKKPEGGEVRLQSAERTAASPVEGHFLVLPESSVVDAFLSISTNRVLNKQVRDFIRNGEDASALEALNQIVTNSRSGRRRRESDVSRTPSRRSVRTVDTRDSRESRRRRYRPRHEDDRDRRRDDARDRRDDESLDRERDRRRDDRRRSERDRDRDRARGGRDRRRRDDSR